MWKEIFELIFRIEPASGNMIVDFFLPMVLSQLFFQFAYSAVGDLYRNGMIESGWAGSAIHWFLRLGTVYLTILLFNFLFAYWPAILSVFALVIILWIVWKVIQKNKR